MELPLNASLLASYTRCVKRRSNVSTNRFELISRVYHVIRMSRPPRTLCVLFIQEKFGCRLNPFVVSLLRLFRPRFWYSVLPPGDCPNNPGNVALVMKLRRGNTLFGNWLTSDCGKPRSAGLNARPGSDRASSRYWLRPARTLTTSDDRTVLTQSTTPPWLTRSRGSWPSCAGPLVMPFT